MTTQQTCKRQEHITGDSQIVMRRWQKLRLCALQHMLKGNWQDALAPISSALETADMLLEYHRVSSGSLELQRFIRTAMDYILILRKNSQDVDMQTLVALIQQRIVNTCYSSDIEKQITPIRDMAFAPIEEAEYWMSILLNMERAAHPKTTKH